jgi:1,4-alpha-glucan branching enzyme
LPESSWGQGGHWQVWLNNDTEWMWPIIHKAEKTMQKLASKADVKNNIDDLTKRALKQASRELLLLESSDWPFLVTTGQAKDYAVDRFKEHDERFNSLVSMIQSGHVEESKVAQIESIDNCFPEVQPKNFGSVN